MKSAETDRIESEWCRLAAQRSPVTVRERDGSTRRATLVGYDKRRRKVRIEWPSGGRCTVGALAVIAVEDTLPMDGAA